MRNLGYNLQQFTRTLRQDIHFAFRGFLSNPKFTLVAVFTLALGIAIVATVFSWISSVILHPFPGVGNPQQLALVETITPSGEVLVNTSYLDYRDYRNNLKQISGIAIARFTPLSVGSDGKTERAWAELVSANYFDLLEVKPILGRTFLPEEGGDKPGAYPVAVLSYKMWQRRYHGDPNILGQTIRLNRHELTIIGVAPKEFHGTMTGVVYDVWMPITIATAMGTGDGTLSYRGTRDITSTIVRLKPGTSIEQARAEVGALAKQLAARYPASNRGVDAIVTPVWAGHLGAQGLLLKPLRILMAISVLLLVIVCANVANLLLARAVSRQKEFGIRLALGAQRKRLIRQLLTETLLLAGAGGLLGLIFVSWLGQALISLMPPFDIPLDLGGGVSPITIAFTMLIVLGSTVAAGMAPALFSIHNAPNEALKEGGRTGSTGAHSHKLRGLLVGLEVALTLVAIIGAGLFFRSFQNASHIEPGFDMNNVSVSSFYLSNAGYTAAEQRLFCRRLRERMEALPGVIGVTYSDVVPLTSPVGSSPWHQMIIDGYTPAANENMMIHRATVPPGYFKLMGIALLRGRDFTERDDEKAPMAVIINESFAQRYFHGADPLGRTIRLERNPATIVGVLKDSKYHTPMEAPIPFFYVPFQQWFAPGLNFSVLMKTAGDPMLVIPDLQREALALNQDAVFHSRRLADAATVSLYPQKVAASLLTIVGLMCLLLAAGGLYSVMSYAISERTQEFGIRMALGAQPKDVLWMVARQALHLTIIGLTVGVLVALLASRFVGGMLVGIRANDPLTFAGAILFLTAVVLLASYFPGRRATHIDPMSALREE